MCIEHGVELVLSNAVPFEDVGGGDHLPCVPALSNCWVKGKDTLYLAAVAAEAAFTLCNGFRDRFHFTLVTICAWGCEWR